MGSGSGGEWRSGVGNENKLLGHGVRIGSEGGAPRGEQRVGVDLSSGQDASSSVFRVADGLLRDDDEGVGFMEQFKHQEATRALAHAAKDDEFAAVPAMMETGFDLHRQILRDGSRGQSIQPVNHQYLGDAVGVAFECAGTFVGNDFGEGSACLDEHNSEETSCSIASVKNEFSVKGLQLSPAAMESFMMESGESLASFEASLTCQDAGNGYHLFPSMGTAESLPGFQTLLTAESPKRLPYSNESVYSDGNAVEKSREDDEYESRGDAGPSSALRQSNDGLLGRGLQMLPSVLEPGDSPTVFATSLTADVSRWHPEDPVNLNHLSEGVSISPDCHHGAVPDYRKDGRIGVPVDYSGSDEHMSENLRMSVQDELENELEASASLPHEKDEFSAKGLQLSPSMMETLMIEPREPRATLEASLEAQDEADRFHLFSSMVSGESCRLPSIAAESPIGQADKPLNHRDLNNGVCLSFDSDGNGGDNLRTEEYDSVGVEDQFQDGPASTFLQSKDGLIGGLQLLPPVIEPGDSSAGFETSLRDSGSWHSERPGDLYHLGDGVGTSLNCIYSAPENRKDEYVGLQVHDEQRTSSPANNEPAAHGLQVSPSVAWFVGMKSVDMGEDFQSIPILEGVGEHLERPVEQQPPVNGFGDSFDCDVDMVPKENEDEHLGLNYHSELETTAIPPSEREELHSEGLYLSGSVIEAKKVLQGSETSLKTEDPKGPSDRAVKSNLGNGVRVSLESRKHSSPSRAEKSLRDERSGSERQKEVAVPLWVKWRGRWESAIQCCTMDCPMATLKTKPNYSKKNHAVVYFPSTRTFSWVDTQHTRPITENPLPLVRGTHASGVEAVKDETLPRRRMLIKLGGEMLDISDRLHIKAVVDSSQNVNVWKTFAKEAAAATQYEELGALLVRLHLTIAPQYIKAGWIARRFSLWKEESANSASAATVQKLTKELINAVLWEDVAPLWNLPEQPELDPEWEHWKGEAFEEKSSDEDPVTKGGNLVMPENGILGRPISAGSRSKRFKEQARARRQKQPSPDVLEILRMRSKPISRPLGVGGSSFGHATTAFRSPLVQPSLLLQGQQAQVLRADNCHEVVPGLTLASSTEGSTPLESRSHNSADPSSNVMVTIEGHQLSSLRCRDGQSPANQQGKSDLSGGILEGPPFFSSGLCSAFLKKKNRRCNRQAKEGITYCGKHKHLTEPEFAGLDLASEGGIAWESGLCSASMTRESTRCVQKTKMGSWFCFIHDHLDAGFTASKNGVVAVGEELLDVCVGADASHSNDARCNGITTRGVRCTHKPKDGFSFCVKHSTQGIIVQVKEESKLQMSVRGSEGATKRLRLPQTDWLTETEKGTGSTVPGQASTYHLSSGSSFIGLGQKSSMTSTELQSGGSDGMSRKRKWVSGLLNFESQTVKSSSSPRQESPLFKISENRADNFNRCVGRTMRNDEQCLFKARTGYSLCSKHLLAMEGQRKIHDEDLKGSSISLSKDLLERYLTAAEGISLEPHGLESQRLLLKWTRAEAAKDYSTAKVLLRLVTLEMSRLQTVLQPNDPAEEGPGEIGMNAIVPEAGKLKERLMTVRCGLCDMNFSVKADLAKHWMDSHRKDVSLFVKGYACRACSRLYSRKHTVRRHWKKRHQSLPVMSPDWLAVCALCNANYADHNVLLDHVVSGHADHLTSTGLKNLAILNGFENPADVKPAKTLECAECREEFGTHWDLFDHKEKKHKNLGTENDGAGTLQVVERRLWDINDIPSSSVPKLFGCRICGKKFPLPIDLKHHKQVEHLSLSSAGTGQDGVIAKRPADLESGRLKLPIRRKADEMAAGPVETFGASRKKNKRFRLQSDKENNEKDPEIGKEALLFRMKAAVQTAQLRTLRLSKHSEVSTARPRKALYSLTKGGQMLPFDGEAKSKDSLNDQELLEMAQSACCRSKLVANLRQEYMKIDEVFLRLIQICNAANCKLEWQAESYICPNNCKELKTGGSFDFKYLVSKPHASVESDEQTFDGRGADEFGVKFPDPENLKSRSTLFTDMSDGQETVPVLCSVENDVANNLKRIQKDGSSSSENWKPWDNFHYITKRVLDPSLGLDPENYKVGCSCEKERCSPEGCDHVDIFDNDNVGALDIYGQPMKGRFPYDEKGCIILEEGYLVYECNSSCRCRKTCQNRVLQKGVTVKLEVFHTLQKGWAVRAAQMIPRGTFVCEYVGEVLHDEEANKRGERYDQVGCSYLYDIDAHLDTTGKVGRSKPFVIDATKHGNVARFINHSCAPNLVNYQVLVDSMDCQLAHIGLFASQDIQIGDELAYDYRYKLLPGKGCPCHCGAQNCRGRLY